MPTRVERNLSSISARSILHVAEADFAAPERSSRRLKKRERVLLVALVLSLAVHLLGGSGAIDWLSGLDRDEPESGPPLRTVLKPPPPPPLVEAPQPPPPAPKPKPRAHPRPAPPVITIPAAEDAPAVTVQAEAPVAPAVQTAEPPPVADAAPPVAQGVPVEEPVPPPPVIPVPKRIDLVGTATIGAQDFMIGTGGFSLRHDGNRYEISVIGRARGLARLVLTGEWGGSSRGAITAEGLQPSEYTEERGGKRETAVLDWEAGVVRYKDDKVAAIETPIHDRLSVIMQFYYKPPAGREHSTRVTGTRYLDTYRFRRRDDEALELPIGIVTAQVWRADYDDGNPRIEIWMSPDYHYLPLKVRIHAKQENGGRFATLSINEIKVED
jgi:hypothetical protein